MLKIESSSQFWADEPNPAKDSYSFIYTINLFNPNSFSVQVLTRSWVVQDGFGKTREVHGEGVVGLQPIIAPNECFEYSSSCSLNTPYGNMHGKYHCRNEYGEEVDIDVATIYFSESKNIH